ncbi:SDR family oxidoreductase [Mechercharimyces sp. CAU 1602]|uniref:SDR family oxidoreductase n=1 Tax=Mechercharimyces sp. CAU 1602 TaxID=2973933 RepID=UPI002161A587|nr:SDR family oxidoreductase [Mechercharimyces sp. CAU 1602]MCS1351781.1 SDR family oxidoreductase [Mechercharimyces sp. CAU 1602]
MNNQKGLDAGIRLKDLQESYDVKLRRVVLVTGSSKGLGKSVAISLAQAGWNVAVHYHSSRSAAVQLVHTLRDQFGCESAPFQADLSKGGESKRLVEQVSTYFGRLDGLVHAVGPFERKRRHFVDYSQAEIEELVYSNLHSAMLAAHTALPYMREHHFGRIVLFGFARVQEAPAWPDRATYAAAKAGLVSFVKSVAVEEAPYGITVNMVAPADIVGENKEKTIEQVKDIYDAEVPRGRPGAGEDVARVVRFLCEEKSDFITGNQITVSGGLDMIHPTSKATETVSPSRHTPPSDGIH